MSEGRADRTQLARRTGHHCQQIQSAREEYDIEPGRLHRAPADLKQAWNLVERMRQINHVGGFRRNVARARDGDSYTRGRERGSIIDTVAEHRYSVASRCELADAVELLLGQ